MSFTDQQIERYSRQLLLKEIGSKGQTALLGSKVAIIGGGGLGCPAAQILAGAGVGSIRIADGDRVDLSNLPRQFLHYTKDIGRLKVESIKKKINAMNPDVMVETIPAFIDKHNIGQILEGVDYVVEASDNIGVKFLVNDACVHLGIPFSIAGVVQYYGQMVSVVPGKTTCYRCIFRDVFDLDPSMTCSGAGVLGTVPAFAANLQANEAIKSIVGMELSFINSMFSFDLKYGTFDKILIKRDPSCKACSNSDHPYYLEADYGPTSPVCGVDLKL